jgi:hypothetical protein
VGYSTSFIYVEDMSTTPFFVLRQKPNCVAKNIKNMTNWIYVNKFLLYRSSRARTFYATRPGGPVQTDGIARLSHVTLYGATRPRLTELRGYVVRLAQDLMSQPNQWRDWESCHRVWRDSWNGTSHARQSGVTGALPIVLNAL